MTRQAKRVGEVVARDLLSLLPFGPVPETLCSLSVHEDQKILVVKLYNLLVDACAAYLGVRDGTIMPLNLHYDGAGQLGNVAANESRSLDIDVQRHLRRGRDQPSSSMKSRSNLNCRREFLARSIFIVMYTALLVG